MAVVDLVSRYSLDVKTEAEFYRGFFHCFFQESRTKFSNVEQLYDEIKKLEEGVKTKILFYPSIEFQFFTEYFLMKFLPVSKFIRFLKNADFTNLKQEKNIFITKYQYFPFESILQDQELSASKKEKKMRRLLAFLSESSIYRRARLLGLADVVALIRMCRHLKIGFSMALMDYDLKRRTVFLDDVNEPITHFKISPYRCDLYYFRFPFFSVIRPWLMFDEICIGSGDPSFHDGSGVPNSSFHDEYVLDGSKQRGDVFISRNGHRFRITYKIGSRMIVQDEEIFRRECEWFRRPSVRIRSLFRLDKFKYIYKYHVIIDEIKRILKDSLMTIIGGEKFDVGMIINSIQFPSDEQKPIEYLKKIYHIVGRISDKEPFYHAHRSLYEKLRNCYLNYDQLFDVPVGVLFPEGHGVDYRKSWDAAFKNFCICLLDRYFQSEYNIRVMDRKKDVPKLPILKEMKYYDIIKNGQLTSLHDSEEEEDPFINYEMIPNGLGSIGILNEAPFYYKEPKNDDRREEPTGCVESMYLDDKDISHFIEKLERRLD